MGGFVYSCYIAYLHEIQMRASSSATAQKWHKQIFLNTA